MISEADQLLMVGRDWVVALHRLLVGKAPSDAAANPASSAPPLSEAESRMLLVCGDNVAPALLSFRTLGARRSEDRVLGAAIRALELGDAIAAAGAGTVYALHNDGATFAGPCVRAHATSDAAVLRAVFAPRWLEVAPAPVADIEGSWTIVPCLPPEAVAGGGVFVPPHDDNGAMLDAGLRCPRGVEYRGRIRLNDRAQVEGLVMSRLPDAPRVEIAAALRSSEDAPFRANIRFAATGLVAPDGGRAQWVTKGDRHGLRIEAPSPDDTIEMGDDATLQIRREHLDDLLSSTQRSDQSPE